MKTTGIVRRVDDLGRIIIPKEIRRNLGIREGDPLELFVEDNMVCFRKYHVYENIRQAVLSLIGNIENDDLCDKDIKNTAINTLVDLNKYIKQEQEKFECRLAPSKPNFTNHTGNAVDYPN